jgi:hypothetical protein
MKVEKLNLTNITLKNYQDNYTLIMVPVSKEGDTSPRTITQIYANIPDSKYGVFMLYTDGKSAISVDVA